MAAPRLSFRAFPTPSHILLTARSRPRILPSPRPLPRPQQRRHQGYYYRRGPSSYQRFQASRSLLQRWAARPTFPYEVGGLAAAVGGFYVYNLEVVPVSGRRRFNVVSYRTEEAMSRQMYQQVLHEFGGRILPDYDKRVRMVKRVLDRLIPASGLTGQKWEVRVIDSPEKNAFVIPGGKVFVFTGLLPVADTDSRLAAVLGHEIAHNIAHHAAERMSQGFVVVGLINLLFLAFGIPDFASQLLLELGFARPGSRKQESEADYIGLMMMAQSCYDPDEAVELWERMEREEEKMGGAPPQFLSTHPSSHNRQEKIREWLPEARAKREASDCASVLDYADDFHAKFRQFRW